jgi:predicted dehydrogenase
MTGHIGGALRVGGTGCGIISRNHLRAGLSCPDIEVTAASSRNSQALTAISDEYGIQNRFKDWRELVACDDVDAVLICLPDGLHEEATCEAAKSGKHVLVEKPMGNSLAECQTMTSATEEAGVCLMVAQVIRQLPSHLLAKRTLREGTIGKVHKATRRRHRAAGVVKPQLEKRPWMSDPQLCTDPLLFGLGSHEFDAMLWLFESEAQTVRAEGTRSSDWSGWETIEGSVSLRSGVDIEVSMAVEADEEVWDTVIQGTDGTITLLTDRIVIDGVETQCPFTHDDAFAAQLDEFASCVRTGREPGPSGRNVLATMAVLDGVLNSMDHGQAVELPELGIQW